MKYDPIQLENWDKEYLWHPFTQMRAYRNEKPLIIAGGEGSYLFDIEGNRYLDGISSLWVTVHGHNKKELNEAIKAQVDQVSHSTLLGLTNIPSIQLAKRLVDITPSGLDKVFYSDSGSTAVEIALKIAYQYWQQKDSKKYKRKTKYLSLFEAYHGDTVGSVSVGGMDLFHSIFKPLLFNGYHAPAPYCYRCPLKLNHEECGLDCLKRAEDIIRRHHEEIVAVVLEPLVQGAAGMLVAPEGYLRGMRDLCNRFNLLLIADEVAVGFGRTGRLFACEHEGVAPDIMCLAKGLTGGYLPLAATLTTEEIFNAFLGEKWENKTFYHGHTYTGNPVACATALANLELIEGHKLIEGLAEKIVLLEQRLRQFKELPYVGDVRQKGMMIGIELVEDKNTKKPFPEELNLSHRVILEARKNGLIIRPLGNVIVLMPILSMSAAELEQVLAITYRAVEKVAWEGTKYGSGY